MIRKELRQRMRERRSWIFPSVYLFVLGAVVAFAYYVTTDQAPAQSAPQQGAQIGIVIFTTVAFTQLSLLLLLVPVFSAGSLTIEKEQRTLAMLLTSLLSSTQIWTGKFASTLLYLLLLLVSALPVLALPFALGGVAPLDLIRVTAMTLLLLASFCAIGLYFSSIFRRSIHSTAVSYAVVIALTVVTFILYAVMQAHWIAVRHSGPAIPRYVRSPLYLNPYYALFATLQRVPENLQKQTFPDWLICSLVFLVIGAAAAILSFRNIRRRGETG